MKLMLSVLSFILLETIKCEVGTVKYEVGTIKYEL